MPRRQNPLRVIFANVDGPNLMGANPLVLSLDMPIGLGSIHAFIMQDPEVAKAVYVSNRSYGPEAAIVNIAKNLILDSPHLIAFTAFAWNMERTLFVADHIKKINPAIQLIFGGPSIPINLADIKIFMEEHPYIDIAVSGEGEETFLEFIKARLSEVSLSQVAGLAFREDGAVVINPRRSQFAPLSTFPSPLLSGTVKYLETSHGEMAVIPLETSRGCPFTCTFCDFHRGQHSLRKFPIERFLEELELVKNWEFRGTIFILDPIVNFNAAHFKQVLRACQDTKTNVFFNPYSELFDDESIELMGQIPKVALSLGVQSISEPAMRSINRVYNVNRITDNIRKLSRLPNLSLSLDLISGLPGDTYDGFKRTLDWALAFDPIPKLGIHHLGVPEDSPLAQMAEQYDITTNAKGFALKTNLFSEEDFMRARWLSRVISFFQNTVSGSSQLRRMVRSSGNRPTDVLERLVDIFLKTGKLSRELYAEQITYT